MKKLLIMALMLVSASANAFYTTYEHDIEKIREGVAKETRATQAEKEAFMQKIIPFILEQRDMAFTKILEGCSADVRSMCKDTKPNLDAKVKCISDNEAKVTDTCKFTIDQVYKRN